MVKAVRVQKLGARTAMVSIPREYALALGISPRDVLLVTVMELEISGVKRKAVVFYKPV